MLDVVVGAEAEVGVLQLGRGVDPAGGDDRGHVQRRAAAVHVERQRRGPEAGAQCEEDPGDDDEGRSPVDTATAPEAGPAEEVLAADEPAAAEKVDPEAPWERLSWRMLLVYPLGMLTRLLPLFLVSLWLGSNRSNYWFEIVIVSMVLTPLTRSAGAAWAAAIASASRC